MLNGIVCLFIYSPAALLKGEVVVTEKLDGGNTCIHCGKVLNIVCADSSHSSHSRYMLVVLTLKRATPPLGPLNNLLLK